MNTFAYNNYPEDEMKRILNINLIVPVELMKMYSKGMIKNKYGKIVNVCSIAVFIGHPDIWYGVSKAGLWNATKSYATILGAYGISVNAVAPGPVDTDMLKEKIPPERVEMLKNNSALKRIAKPEEIARTIYWLATDAAEYINGVCIDINNGAYLR